MLFVCHFSPSKQNLIRTCRMCGPFFSYANVELDCSSVSDPHRFYADPDPAFLLNADPDPEPDPDPTCRI
jgi:hypothetical protein